MLVVWQFRSDIEILFKIPSTVQPKWNMQFVNFQPHIQNIWNKVFDRMWMGVLFNIKKIYTQELEISPLNFGHSDFWKRLAGKNCSVRKCVRVIYCIEVVQHSTLQWCKNFFPFINRSKSGRLIPSLRDCTLWTHTPKNYIWSEENRMGTKKFKTQTIGISFSIIVDANLVAIIMIHAHKLFSNKLEKGTNSYYRATHVYRMLHAWLDSILVESSVNQWKKGKWNSSSAA